MDAMKAAFVGAVKRHVRWMADDSHTQDCIMNASGADEALAFEYQEGAPLTCRIRITQGPHKGPRYFEVIVKEVF
jgi:hypothetical protein